MVDRESEKNALAHGRGQSGETHRLDDHLREVAELCKRFANRIGLPTCGYLLGYWHDIGKLAPEWQAYLKASIDANAGGTGAIKGPAHSPVGALRASELWWVAMAIAAHHSSLHSRERFRGLLRDYAKREAVRAADRMWREREPEWVESAIKEAKQEIKLQADDERTLEFLVRFLLSMLVDADRLDTEAHCNPDKAGLRSGGPDLKWMKQQLDAELTRITENAKDTKVNRIRSEVLSACRAAATESQGIFRLTAPTGAGKTLSSLAFALSHAAHHNLERIIVAIPYMSIIDQTASVYRKILGPDCVLEHHSAVSEIDEVAGETDERLRLAVENWDHPLIVTTTNQLFESLLSNRASRCRKIHNVARSVVILDEVQTLPVELLQTTLEAVRFIASHCGATAVLCTATQPDISSNKHFRGLEGVREILPDARKLFEALRRVEYAWPKEKQSWDELAGMMLQEKQVLTVVNTKADALKLLDALQDENSLHLSTSLCGAHRKRVIDDIRSRLRNGEHCRVVSTQVVEAGVDLDFPVVMRAVGPLDRIVQVAGRCNREGRMGCGKVIVFDPEDGGMPLGAYATGAQEAASLINEDLIDPNDPLTFERYFSRLYGSVETDRYDIEERRKHLDYPEVAKRYQFIRDNMIPVVAAGWRPEEIEPILAAIRTKLGRGGSPTREDFRRLQPYVVNLREDLYRQCTEWADDSVPGVAVWRGPYHCTYGLVTEQTRPQDMLW